MLPATVLSISVMRSARELYDMIWMPEAFPRWASGLSRGGLEREGDRWKATGPDGAVRIRFSERNSFGVMDHWVDVGPGPVVYVPLRIVENGEGSEVMLTLFRQPGMSAETFAADEALVLRDLSALKSLAESG